jgi:hypothetical protein
MLYTVMYQEFMITECSFSQELESSSTKYGKLSDELRNTQGTFSPEFREM